MRRFHARTFLGIGLFVLLVLGFLYIFVVRGILIGYGPGHGDIRDLDLPHGFTVTYFAANLTGARSITVVSDERGTDVFVGTREAGVVYDIVDTDRDGKENARFIIANKLEKPNGVAYAGNTLYVAESHRILAFHDIRTHRRFPPKAQVIRELPHDNGHEWKFIAIGPDGKLYIPIGAPCNACDRGPLYATINRMDLSGQGWETVASGVRNTVGFDWDARGALWFTDNGRDWLGDTQPGDELNVLRTGGQHFGFPYCHQGNLTDPDFTNRSCSEFTPPALVLGPHVAALGMRFANTSTFPARYQNGVFIAEHGSWNSQTPQGYRVMFVPFTNGTPHGYEIFMDGFLGSTAWGRPVDIAFLPDGSMLVSDDKAGAIYRVAYTG